MRESKEFYSSGEEVSAGVYRNLNTRKIFRIFQNGKQLPEEPDEKVVIYERISGNPLWQRSKEENNEK